MNGNITPETAATNDADFRAYMIHHMAVVETTVTDHLGEHERADCRNRWALGLSVTAILAVAGLFVRLIA